MPYNMFQCIYFPDDEVLRQVTPTFVEIAEPFVSGFIKGQFNDTDLGELGIRVRQLSGDICTAFIPLSRLRELEKMPGIEYVELARPLQHDLNSSLSYNQISILKGSPRNLTGNDVVIGVIDSHLNFYHPDFRNDDGGGGDGKGTSRVLYLWDQRLIPRAGETGPPKLPGFQEVGNRTASSIRRQISMQTSKPISRRAHREALRLRMPTRS